MDVRNIGRPLEVHNTGSAILIEFQRRGTGGRWPAVAHVAPGPAPFAPTQRAYEAGEFEAGPAAVLLSAVIPDAHYCSGWALDS